ncbi:hypothetical protein [Aquaspirillum sp. LM1]|uniref:hypothetical protein n=1 Tax=Aquaspirillum sp. LM1 TaxID=1938604 RepID=UPI0012372D38|nr:hypothetical protein [Aquaspirillum sp. LM1]
MSVGVSFFLDKLPAERSWLMGYAHWQAKPHGHIDVTVTQNGFFVSDCLFMIILHDDFLGNPAKALSSGACPGLSADCAQTYPQLV